MGSRIHIAVRPYFRAQLRKGLFGDVLCSVFVPVAHRCEEFIHVAVLGDHRCDRIAAVFEPFNVLERVLQLVDDRVSQHFSYTLVDVRHRVPSLELCIEDRRVGDVQPCVRQLWRGHVVHKLTE